MPELAIFIAGVLQLVNRSAEMKMTEWRSIDEYPAYEVSTGGEVRRVLPWKNGGNREGRVPPYTLKAKVGRHGYAEVGLHNAFGQKTCKTHVLVALTFIGPRPEGQQILHLDANKMNPSLSNLRYGTQSENEADKKVQGRSLHFHKLGPHDLNKIKIMRSNGAFLWEIGEHFGVHETTILRALRNGHLRQF